VLRKVISIAFSASLIPAHVFAADPSHADSLQWQRPDDGRGGIELPRRVAIDGERIVAVGSNNEVQRLAGRRTKVLDLGGRTVIPGLGDAHNHAIRGGQTFRFETYWYDVTTLAVALEVLKEAACEEGPGKVGWRVAGSGAPEQFKENRGPHLRRPHGRRYRTIRPTSSTLYDLRGRECARCGSALGWTSGMRPYPASRSSGMPTADRRESSSATLGRSPRSSPAIAASGDEERKQSLASYFAALNGRGVTSIVDAAGGGSGFCRLRSVIRPSRRRQADVCASRTAFSAQTPGNEAAWFSSVLFLHAAALRRRQAPVLGAGRDRRVQGKRRREDVAGDSMHRRTEGEELYKVAVMAARRKYPLEIHAYTDDAAEQILDVFERVSQTGEHAESPLVYCSYPQRQPQDLRADEEDRHLLQRADGAVFRGAPVAQSEFHGCGGGERRRRRSRLKKA